MMESIQARYGYEDQIKELIAYPDAHSDEFLAKYNPSYKARWGASPPEHFEYMTKNYIRSPHANAEVEKLTMIPPLTG